MSEFEEGEDLSTGQWQRVALARAYARDAELVVLDEPSAALDPRAEVEVYSQLREAAQGRAAVLISHRLGSARLADRIVVLDGGRIVEEGSHAELSRRGGLYAHLLAVQAAPGTATGRKDGGPFAGGSPPPGASQRAHRPGCRRRWSSAATNRWNPRHPACARRRGRPPRAPVA